MNYIENMLKIIGNTPLLKLNKIGKDVPANIFVKLEYLNPSGSYKDRMALSMIEAAEKGLTWNNKKLGLGGVVVDASAGNTAPALAFICAVKGYKAKLFIYKPMLQGLGVRLKITGAFGADINESPHPSSFLSNEELAQCLKDNHDLTYIMAGKMHAYELEKNDPNVIWVDQIYNKYNYLGQMSIGYELYKQLGGAIDAFGCAVGSGATLLGSILGLAENNIHPLTFGVVPHGSEVYMELQKNESKKGEFKKSNMMEKLINVMGLKKWETEKSIIDEMLDRGYPDEFFRVTAEEARYMANRLCKEEGIYCGMSSGANVFVALKIAKRLNKGQNVVTVIVDRRDRYLGEYPNDVFIV
ncbi:MAG: cysteine synthase family protein [Atribacterota bacterium]|nr:cysteine synthase family protein [Atribacterota bacterium]MDD5638203.1 cysteine synthase family protein [Atribacterota bacterium]